MFPLHTDNSPVCDSAEKNRWFSHLVGPGDGHLLGTFTSCHKLPFTSCSRVSGFRGKQAEAAAAALEGETNTECRQKVLFFRHEAWMEVFDLDGIFITPASFLLNFKSKQLSETEEQSYDDSYGMLCLYLFNTKEYVYHRLSESSLIVRCCETTYPPLLLTSKSLAVPVFDIMQDQLVHKVMYLLTGSKKCDIRHKYKPTQLYIQGSLKLTLDGQNYHAKTRNIVSP